jgi:hypothetical protein
MTFSLISSPGRVSVLLLESNSDPVPLREGMHDFAMTCERFGEIRRWLTKLKRSCLFFENPSFSNDSPNKKNVKIFERR